MVDAVPGLHPEQGHPGAPMFGLSGRSKLHQGEQNRRVEEVAGGPNAALDIYGLMSLSKLRFFSQKMFKELDGHLPYADLQPPSERMRRWHSAQPGPLFWGRASICPGLLPERQGRPGGDALLGGDRAYPFLDEGVFDFLAKVHPHWKLRGLRDKYLLRRMAERWLPKSIAWRRKEMFRAPFVSFPLAKAPRFVDELLTEESRGKAGYFEPSSVHPLAAGVSGRCVPVQPSGSCWKWGWSASWRRSCGTTRSSMER